MDRNPCLSCDLRDEDKNGRRCMECGARVEYVSGLVGRSHSVGKAIKNEHRMLNGKNEGRAAVKPQAKTGENKMTILEDKVEEIIEEICGEASVSVANLRAFRRGSKYTVARLKIAERLIANYGMTQRKIGELTGVSAQAIGYLLSKGTYASPTHASSKGSRLRLTATPRQDAGQANAEGKKTGPKPEKTATIDFSGHAEILKLLEKHAKEEIRSVPDQILYFIQTSLSWVEDEAHALPEGYAGQATQE